MNPILQVLAAEGLTILEADQTAILAASEKFTDEELNKVAGALANALPSNGVLGLIDGPIKTALVAAEPELDTIANDGEAELYTALENAFKNVAGSTSSAPAASAAHENAASSSSEGAAPAHEGSSA